MAPGDLLQRFRQWRNGAVWRLEDAGQSGMEPSHRHGSRVSRHEPDEDVVVFGMTRERRRKKRR